MTDEDFKLLIETLNKMLALKLIMRRLQKQYPDPNPHFTSEQKAILDPILDLVEGDL